MDPKWESAHHEFNRKLVNVLIFLIMSVNQLIKLQSHWINKYNITYSNL